MTIVIFTYLHLCKWDKVDKKCTKTLLQESQHTHTPLVASQCIELKSRAKPTIVKVHLWPLRLIRNSLTKSRKGEHLTMTPEQPSRTLHRNLIRSKGRETQHTKRCVRPQRQKQRQEGHLQHVWLTSRMLHDVRWCTVFIQPTYIHTERERECNNNVFLCLNKVFEMVYLLDLMFTVQALVNELLL